MMKKCKIMQNYLNEALTDDEQALNHIQNHPVVDRNLAFAQRLHIYLLLRFVQVYAFKFGVRFPFVGSMVCHSWLF